MKLSKDSLQPPRRLSRRDALAGAVAAVGSFSLGSLKAAASSSAASTFAESRASTGDIGFPAASVAKQAETRVVSLVPSSPPGLDPQSASGIAGAVSFDIYNTLITYEIDEELGLAEQTKHVPELAESWEIAPDLKSVTFKLRPDATFSDGTPVTAEDVRFSLERAIEGKLGWGTTQLATGNISSVDQLEAVDERTFRVTYPDGMGRYSFRNFGTMSLTVMSKKYVLDHATPDDPYAGKHLQRQPMGSGPYTLQSWVPGESLVLKARDDSSDAAKAYFKESYYRFVPDSQTRVLLMQAGEADIVQGLAPKDWQTLQQDPNVQVLSVPRNQDVLVLRWNPTVEPFDDPNIRQAVIKALPYRAILDQTVYGFGTEVKNLIGVSTYGYQALPLFETDIEEARRLVRESKYPDSALFTLLVNSDQPDRVAAAVMIQSALRDVGIGMEIEQLPLAAYQERCNTRQLPVNLHSMGPWFNDALYWAYWMFESSSATNYIGYSNPDLDEAVKEALFVAPEDRQRYDPLLNRVINEILIKEAVAAPLYQVNWTIAAKKGIDNLIYWPWASFELKDLRPAGE